jgi:hydrophobe/amphiphile efflux-3 (HAE3) family protein
LEWTDPLRLLSALAVRAARRPVLTVALLAAVGLAGAMAALSLRPTAAADTLVGRSSAAYRDTQRFYGRFGEEPIDVVVSGDLRKLLLSSDLDRLVGLEGCLSGNLPTAAFAGEGGANGPCARLARAKAVKVVLGPGTFINEAALQIDGSLAARRRQAEAQARQARDAVYRGARARGLEVARAHALASEAAKATMAGFAAEVSAVAIRYGLTSTPSLDNHQFVSMLVFDSSRPSGTPKERFAYLFPSREAALVSIRLKAGLSESRRSTTLALIRRAVAMGQWRLANGESYLVTGEPVIAHDLESSIGRSIELLLVVVLLTMGIILSLVFDVRPRLLPLAVALLAAALTLGGTALAGASLTMASVAVLPVLVGLAVDYAIQFQTRLSEAMDRCGDVLAAAEEAARRGGPAIATAGLASVVGLLVLLLSPVPMVRGFGVLLVVGVVVAFVCALLLSSATLALGQTGMAGLGQWPRRRGMLAPAPWRRRGAGAGGSPLRVRRATAGSLAAAWAGAGDLLRDNAVNRVVSRLALQHAVARPGRVLAIGLALAALGWGLDTQTAVQTDIAKLAPQDMGSLVALRTLERASGVGGEIDLMVSSRALAKPATIEWMSRYERTVLRRFGYGASRGCGRAELCPAFSLPDLFTGGEGAPAKLTEAQVGGLLRAIPPYFSQAVITPDRRVATLAFGIRLMPLERQQRVIEQMRASLHPPAGVSARLVGLSVLAAGAGAEVASPWRRVSTLLVALVAVALVLLLAFRGDLRRALVPFAPVVLATGWSALLLFATRVPLNPMSVTLGALVIAISTEFSVLLSERCRQESLAGYGTVQALRRAYRHTGAAVAASGATAIAGFGVLAFSDIAMLRDFGLVTLVDLGVSLVGVFVALPAAVMLAGRKERLWARATRATSPSLG